MSKQITLQVRPRGKPIKRLPESVEVSSSATAADLYNILSKRSQFSVHQLRVTKGSDGSHIPNAKDGSVHDTGLRDQSTIYVKDLGPQIAWRTVFIIEYLGPIFIHPLFYYYHSLNFNPSVMQKAALVAIIAHFVKREFETLFVHRFSAATMPMRNIFKNSAHYWLLSGFNMAYWLYRPNARAATSSNSLLLPIGLILYAIGELANMSVHFTLRDLRSSSGNERGIPQGYLFDLVTCPNYMAEVISWIGVFVMSAFDRSVLLFAIVSTAQMAQWAKKKESRYRKEFGDKYKKKSYTMLPGIW